VRKTRVLRTVGNEAENELPFAAAQQLCIPGLAALEDLPAPQREALGVAFGHITGPAPDRLFVGLALLGLLSQLAFTDPVLCVIDDAQWLDRESAQAFATVARRLGPEHIAFLFGARAVPSDLNRLPGLSVEGLGPADARALLRSALPDPFDERVLERILAEARGNPLALLELPHGQTPAELAGGFALPPSIPLAGHALDVRPAYRFAVVKEPVQAVEGKFTIDRLEDIVASVRCAASRSRSPIASTRRRATASAGTNGCARSSVAIRPPWMIISAGVRLFITGLPARRR
jgi:hypothetical protein